MSRRCKGKIFSQFHFQLYVKFLQKRVNFSIVCNEERQFETPQETACSTMCRLLDMRTTQTPFFYLPQFSFSRKDLVNNVVSEGLLPAVFTTPHTLLLFAVMDSADNPRHVQIRVVGRGNQHSISEIVLHEQTTPHRA